MRIDIFSLFPLMFLGPFQESILKRAQERDVLTIFLHQIRDYAFDRHQMTDDLPYGGGQGMVMKPEPIFSAVRAVLRDEPAPADKASVPVILLSPQGRPFTHSVAETLATEPRIALICGHYEGIDERVREHLVTDELSIGDYVLTGGELAAMVVVDAVARFIPGVLGAAEARTTIRMRGVCSKAPSTHVRRRSRGVRSPRYCDQAITQLSHGGNGAWPSSAHGKDAPIWCNMRHSRQGTRISWLRSRPNRVNPIRPSRVYIWRSTTKP